MSDTIMNTDLLSKYYRLFFEEAPVGLALCHMKDGSFVLVNRAFAEILGRTVEATMGLEYWQVTPTKYAKMEEVQLRLLREKGEYGPYEKEFLHRTGALVPVRLRGRRVIIDGKEYIWSMVEDRSQEKYRILFKRATVGLVLSILDGGRIIDVNDQFINDIGYSEEELLEMTFGNLTPDRYRHEEVKHHTELVKNGRCGPYSKHLIHKGGDEFPVIVTDLKIELDGFEYIWSIVERGIIGGNVSESGGQSPKGPSRPITPIDPSAAQRGGERRPIRPLEGQQPPDDSPPPST